MLRSDAGACQLVFLMKCHLVRILSGVGRSNSKDLMAESRIFGVELNGWWQATGCDGVGGGR